MTVLNACTKIVWKLIEWTTYQITDIHIYTYREIEREMNKSNKTDRNVSLCLFSF